LCCGLRLLLFRSWTAGALLRGDGFDDEAAGLGRVDCFGRELEGLGDEVLDRGRVEEGRVFELDVADLIATALEAAGRVAEAGAVDEEKEADPAGEERNGEDGFGGALGGAESDGEGVVVVVDELDGAGEAGAYFAEGGTGLGRNLGGELIQEFIQLGRRG
jgi:hypothetical protein